MVGIILRDPDTSKNITISVTGASGFLGNAIVPLLVEYKYIVKPLTRKKIPGYIHVNSYHETPESDVLIHLAEEPDRHIVNVKGKAYMQEAIKLSTALSKKKYKKIIYASSGAVYGNSSVKPHKVSDDAVSNDSYSSIKLECEKIILDAGGLVARFSNLYGTGMSDNNVVSDIANQMSNDESVYVNDDMPVCDFIEISDAANALLALCDHNGKTGLYNIGTGIGTSIGTLAKLILNVTNQNHRVIVSRRHTGNSMFCNILDITDTTKLIGWIPKLSIEQGIAKLMAESTI